MPSVARRSCALIVAFAAALVVGARARTLSGKRNSPAPCPPDAWDCGATSIFDREKCGRLGQHCCELHVDDYKWIEVCDGDALYCLNFPGQSDGGSSDGGSSSAADNRSSNSSSDGGSDGGSQQLLNLCLPKPDGCGAASGMCCPLTGTKANTTHRCQANSTICLSPKAGSIFGRLTYALYMQLQQDPQTSISDDVGLSVWGTCQVFDAAACGTPGGLCGPRLEPPAPVCTEDASRCLEGYYCQEQEGQWLDFGLCESIPQGCGQLGSACCPYGNYSQGSFGSPFCWDEDVYCAARANNVSDATCCRLPKSPEECGMLGGPCCPSPAGLITDKPLPSMCQDGSYCNVSSSGGAGTGTCMANAANCGGIAKPCCVVNGRVGLLYTCNNGFFCPDPEDEGVVTSGGNGATTGSVMMAVVGPHDRACQECTPLVPTKYQAACGYGISSGSANNDDDYCNPDDYYCLGDYAPASASGPYSDSVQPEEEEAPPLGPGKRAPTAAPAQAPAPTPTPDLGIAEPEAPPGPAAKPPTPPTRAQPL